MKENIRPNISEKEYGGWEVDGELGVHREFREDQKSLAYEYYEQQMLIYKQKELVDLQLENAHKESDKLNDPKNIKFKPFDAPKDYSIPSPIIFETMFNYPSTLVVRIKHKNIEIMRAVELESYIMALEIELARVEEHIKSKSK